MDAEASTRSRLDSERLGADWFRRSAVASASPDGNHLEFPKLAMPRAAGGRIDAGGMASLPHNWADVLCGLPDKKPARNSD
jgi:hypothetical protein